jgi:hypothetical protein
MGIFTSQEDSIKEEDRESAFDRIEKQFLMIPDLPEEVDLCALFTGDNGVGKSGAATTYIKFLNKGECMVYVDLDAGDKDNLVQYWKEEVADGKLRYFYPIVWEQATEKGKQARINYDRSIEEMRLIAMWILKEDEEGIPNYARHKIKAVVLDGISKLKGYAEYQMKNETNMDRTGDPKRKYWRIRNTDFLETLELYKVLPIDTIFVGKEDFNKAPDEMVALDRQTNDLISQKLAFRTEKTEDGKTQFIARVLKSRQSFENREKEIVFAEIDPNNEEQRTWWDASKVFELLRPAKEDQDIKEEPRQEREKPKVPPKKPAKKRGRPKKEKIQEEQQIEENTETPFG